MQDVEHGKGIRIKLRMFSHIYITFVSFYNMEISLLRSFYSSLLTKVRKNYKRKKATMSSAGDKKDDGF
jgi:hypothetical protein